MKTKPQAAQGKPGAGTGIEWAEKRRTIFRAEAPENGPYYRYDPTTGEWKERQPWTAEELAEAAVNSTPVTGRVATELGGKDFNPAGVIGHEDAQGLLLTTGLPRAARTKRFEFNPATGELDWVHEVPKALEQVLDPTDGIFPNVSVSLMRDFVAEGGEALGGPAIRHVAFLGATPPVKRNLGAWNPELYTPSDNGEAPRRALPKGVELVTFSENAADDCEVVKHEPAAAADTDEEAEPMRTQPKTKGAGAPARGPAREITPEAFAELEQRATAAEELLKRQGGTMRELRTQLAGTQATVAQRESAAKRKGHEEFAERMHRSGASPGPTRAKRIRETLDKVSGLEQFAEGEATDAATVVMELLEAVAVPVDATGGRVSSEVLNAGAAQFAELDKVHGQYKAFMAKNPNFRQGFEDFAAGDGFAPEMVAEWAVKRGLKPEARKPR